MGFRLYIVLIPCNIAVYICLQLHEKYHDLLLKMNAIYNLKSMQTTFDINSDAFGIQIDNIVCREICIFLQVKETGDIRHPAIFPYL